MEDDQAFEYVLFPWLDDPNIEEPDSEEEEEPFDPVRDGWVGKDGRP
jgi:hypothetical protein